MNFGQHQIVTHSHPVQMLESGVDLWPMRFRQKLALNQTRINAWRMLVSGYRAGRVQFTVTHYFNGVQFWVDGANILSYDITTELSRVLHKFDNRDL